MDCPDDIEERARELHANGGIPEKRARIVAAAELRPDWTHKDIQKALNLSSRGNVGRALGKYEDDLEEAKWLVEYGPDR